MAEFHPRPEDCFARKSRIPPTDGGMGTESVTAPTDGPWMGTESVTAPTDGPWMDTESVAVVLKEREPKDGQRLHGNSRSEDRPVTAAEFPASSDDGSNAEPGWRKDEGSKLDPTPTGQSTCNFTANWEADFDVEPLKSVDVSHLASERTGEEGLKLKQLLWEIKDCLSDGTLNFGGDVKMPHSTTCGIATNVDNPTIVSYNRSADPEAHKEFAEMTAKNLKQGIIEPSHAPWSSNAELVKKDGKTRMVIDYRSLNKVTVKDAYPMPKVQDLMDQLKCTKWFTGIDCVQAFHQIPMANERAKDLTTFRGPGGGLFRYRFMPMVGECNGHLEPLHRQDDERLV